MSWEEQAVSGKQAQLDGGLVPFRVSWKGELNRFSGLADVCQTFRFILCAVSEAHMNQMMHKCAVKNCYKVGHTVT